MENDYSIQEPLLPHNGEVENAMCKFIDFEQKKVII